MKSVYLTLLFCVGLVAFALAAPDASANHGAAGCGGEAAAGCSSGHHGHHGYRGWYPGKGFVRFFANAGKRRHDRQARRHAGYGCGEAAAYHGCDGPEAAPDAPIEWPKPADPAAVKAVPADCGKDGCPVPQAKAALIERHKLACN